MTAREGVARVAFLPVSRRRRMVLASAVALMVPSEGVRGRLCEPAGPRDGARRARVDWLHPHDRQHLEDAGPALRAPRGRAEARRRELLLGRPRPPRSRRIAARRGGRLRSAARARGVLLLRVAAPACRLRRARRRDEVNDRTEGGTACMKWRMAFTMSSTVRLVTAVSCALAASDAMCDAELVSDGAPPVPGAVADSKSGAPVADPSRVVAGVPDDGDDPAW